MTLVALLAEDRCLQPHTQINHSHTQTNSDSHTFEQLITLIDCCSREDVLMHPHTLFRVALTLKIHRLNRPNHLCGLLKRLHLHTNTHIFTDSHKQQTYT